MAKFNDLTDESKILKITAPIFTPVTKNPDDETEEQIMTRHRKFLNLPEPVKDKLASVEISEKIQKIGTYFKLELLQLADISRTIRNYYFSELKLEDMPFLLAKEMNVDLTKAKEITQVVIDKIINDRSQEEAYQSGLEQLLIPDALKKYPEIGEQLITANRIKIKSFPDLARPSLKNWLADYHFTLDRGSHNSVERSNYLFHTGNTQTLSTSDRQKLSYLLKCLDENIPVTVSKSAKQIIFPKNPENEPANAFSAPAAAPKNNIQSIEFSYPQKPAYQKPQPFTPTVAANQTIKLEPKPEKPRPLPRNVVNLREV